MVGRERLITHRADAALVTVSHRQPNRDLAALEALGDLRAMAKRLGPRAGGGGCTDCRGRAERRALHGDLLERGRQAACCLRGVEIAHGTPIPPTPFLASVIVVARANGVLGIPTTIVLEPLLTKGPAFHHCCFGFECPPSAVGGQAASKGTSLQVISANQLFSRDNPPSGPSLVWLQTRENPNLPKRSRAHAHAHLVRSDPPPAAEWTRWRSLDQSGARSLARSIEFCFPFLARLVQRAIVG